MSVSEPTPHSALRTPNSPSAWRAWCYLVWLSWQRQMRARQMVWIAVGLLAFTAAIVTVNTVGGWWDMHNWRTAGAVLGGGPPPPPPLPDENVRSLLLGLPRVPGVGAVEFAALGAMHVLHDNPPPFTPPPPQRRKLSTSLDHTEAVLLALPRPPGVPALDLAAAEAAQSLLDQSPFLVFTNNFIFTVFLPFLLPLLSLSFATEALGGDREANSLVWLLTRPMARPAIYLAKFAAMLPWSLCLNIGGFALLCLLAGAQGKEALRLFWPAVVWATLAFSALFFLIGAFFRRPAIVAIVYSFFLETILGNMPGYLKRVSINFYTKCMMYEAAEPYGIAPDRPHVFLPVDAATALVVLVTLTLLLVAVGIAIFSRVQYQDAV